MINLDVRVRNFDIFIPCRIRSSSNLSYIIPTKSTLFSNCMKSFIMIMQLQSVLKVTQNEYCVVTCLKLRSFELWSNFETDIELLCGVVENGDF